MTDPPSTCFLFLLAEAEGVGLAPPFITANLPVVYYRWPNLTLNHIDDDLTSLVNYFELAFEAGHG